MSKSAAEKRDEQRLATRVPRAWNPETKLWETVPHTRASAVDEPRVLPVAESLYFTFTDGTVEDLNAPEIAALLNQAASWMLMNPDRVILSVSILECGSERPALVVVAE